MSPLPEANGSALRTSYLIIGNAYEDFPDNSCSLGVVYCVNFVHLSVERRESRFRFGSDKWEQEGWMSSGFAVLPDQVKNPLEDA